MGIVMGYWDCAYCNTKGIGGDTKICPNCGMTRNENTRFYMDKSMPVKRLSNEEAKKVEEKGPDWICGYCDGLNPADIDICATCGAPRDENSVDYFESKRRAEEAEAVEKIDIKNTENRVEKPKRDNSVRDERIRSGIYGVANTIDRAKSILRSRGKGILIISLVILLFASIVFFGVKACAPREATMLVTGTEWIYSVEIEAYKTVQESGWSVPPGGRLSYTRQEIHHYDDVLDHYETKYRQVQDGYEDYVAGYEDMGNGYMKEIIRQRPKYRSEPYQDPVYRQEPVYATKYYYDIDKWTSDRMETSRGTDKICRWPELYLDSNERTGDRFETYEVTGIINNKSVTQKISKVDFDKIEEGMELRVVLRLGRKMEILWDNSEKTSEKTY